MQNASLHSYRCIIAYRPAPAESDLTIVGVKAPNPSAAERAVQAVTGCALVLDTYRQDHGQ